MKMETATLRTCSPAEIILITAFKKNDKILVPLIKGEFRGKSLREALLIIKERNELSEEILIRIID